MPHSDEHQGEYLPARAERLAWLTAVHRLGWRGGGAEDKAALFVDGRYTLQAAAQTDTRLIEPRDLVGEGPQGWIADQSSKGSDAGLRSLAAHRQWRGDVAPCGGAGRRGSGRL